MSSTAPSSNGKPAPHPAAGLNVALNDPFKERAEREARKRAEKAARKAGPAAAAGTAAVAPAFFNPFARPTPPLTPVVTVDDAEPEVPPENSVAGPETLPEAVIAVPEAAVVEPVGEAPAPVVEAAAPEDTFVAPDPEAAVVELAAAPDPKIAPLANGDGERIVEAVVEPADGVAMADAPTPVILEASWEDDPLAARDPAHDRTPKAANLFAASTSDPKSAPQPAIETPVDVDADADADAPADDAAMYWSGKKGGGNGGGQPPRERTFNQDDLVGFLLALLLLLFGGWMFFNGLGSPDGDDDALVSPQLAGVTPEAAPEPAPLADPFGPGPVDLRPSSPIPEPVEAPPVTVADVAPPPETVAAPPVAKTCEPGRVVRAYFCTASSDLTEVQQATLEGELADLQACAGEEELVVTGYADRRGPEAFNAYLGEQRATRLADLLRAKGMKVAEVSGVGELTDIEDNLNCANQRRVDVSLKASLVPPSRSCAPPEEVAKLVCG